MRYQNAIVYHVHSKQLRWYGHGEMNERIDYTGEQNLTFFELLEKIRMILMVFFCAFIKKYLSWSVVTKESGTQKCRLTSVGLSGGTCRRQNTVESPKGKHF